MSDRRQFGNGDRAKRTAAGVGIAVAALLAAGLWAFVTAAPRPAPASALEVRGERLLVGGSPAQIRGVYYNPWLSTPGADGQIPSFRHDLVEQDLDDISRLGANAIEVFEAPASVVVDAARRGLVTLYGFDIDWSDTSRAAFEQRGDAIVSGVRALGGHAGIGMWLLGRDVPARVVDALGRAEVERRLNLLASRVKAIDPARPVGHANGAATAELELDGFDVACFDLTSASASAAPAGPGIGRHLREVLAPRAHGRPLLVTGFGSSGAGAGEVRQAGEIAEALSEIARFGVGGVVFEWADGAWTRPPRAAPVGAVSGRRLARNDGPDPADPAARCGIVRADRTPKPALAAVRRMWRAEARRTDPWLAFAGLSLLSLPFLRTRRRLSPSRVALVLFCTLCWASLGPCSLARAEGPLLQHSGWEFYPAGTVDLHHTTTRHGDPVIYADAPAIPPPGPLWQPLTGSQGQPRNPFDIDYLGPHDDYSSDLRSCLTQAEFAYFECFVDIPASVSLQSAILRVGPLDDGARIVIFNSSSPSGVSPPGGIILLGDTQSQDLASYLKSGESNRIVIQHEDDCAAQGWLGTVELVLNGTKVAQGRLRATSWGEVKAIYR